MTRTDLKTNARQKLAKLPVKRPATIPADHWSVITVAVIELLHTGLMIAGPVAIVAVVMAAIWR